MTPYTTLTAEEVQHFIDHGYVIVKGCFSKEAAREAVDLGWKRLGLDRHDPAAWDKPMIHMPAYNQHKVREFSPKAWGAICDLVGGAENILAGEDYAWGDGFIVNFNNGADRPWEPPSPATKGWHVDGDWFYHFLDSGEQGLLLVVIWQDIQHQGGGTLIAPDSIRPVSELLLRHPEGLDPYNKEWGTIAAQCSEFIEVTGEAGDVAMLHPLMLHASSQNVSGIPRFMTNPFVQLKNPLILNRENPADYNPIERGILKALGVDSLDFQITTERRPFVPARIAEQARMLEEQKKRLAENP
jgi:hypothetical protein